MDFGIRKCPFCGRIYSLKVDKYKSSGVWWYFVTDTECMTSGPVCSTSLGAIDAWNTRESIELE